MPILKKKNSKSENEEYLGAYMPRYIFEHLTLYAIFHDKPKSEVVRNILRIWHMDMNNEKFAKFDIIDKLAKKLHLEWRNPPGRRMNFNTFISSLKIELANKGIREGDINVLIKLLKDEKEQGDKEE